MKHLSIIIIILFPVMQPLFARSEMTQAKHACNLIELALWDELLSEGKDLPASWDEIPIINHMKRNASTQNLSVIEHINALALVPGTPLIRSESGISPDRSNKKLFAISRDAGRHAAKPNADDEPTDTGRYAIFVAKDNRKTESIWIPELEAQLILKQIEGFDPGKQPRAFENVEQIARDKQAEQEKLNDEFEDYLRKSGKIGPDGKLIHDRSKRQSVMPYVAVGTIVASIVAACLIFGMLRKRAR